MRIIQCIFLFIIISSCTQQNTSSESTNEETNNPKSPQVSLDNENESNDGGGAEFQEDSTFYIGFVNYFTETKEFYTSLYYRKDRVDDNDALNKLLDSTVYEDAEITRRRLPMTDARKWFVTEDMHKLFIFNSQHKLVTTAALIRIEKLDGPIESEFIAVYKPEIPIIKDSEPYYGISEEKHGYKTSVPSTQHIEDPQLDQVIIQSLQINSPGLRITHYKISPENSVYSVVSSDHESYITEFKETNVKILDELHDDTFFTGIFLLPIVVNDRPLLLVGEAVQESDVMWNYLAVFQDSTYVPVSRGRMRINY